MPMKEIVIMAGAIDPEKKFIAVLKRLFPECTIRVVYAGSESEGKRFHEREAIRGIDKTVPC